MDVTERLKGPLGVVRDREHISAVVDAIVEIRRLRAEIERLRTPDMIDAAWQWTGLLDEALWYEPALTIMEVESAHRLGPAWVVRIPTGASDSNEDCHIFTTREEAEAAVAKAKGAQDG